MGAIYEANRGRGCDGPLSDMTSCSMQACKVECSPVDCLWGPWESWSACDKCGGQRKRFRHITRHPLCGGKSCPQGTAEEISNCTRKCHDKLLCVWNDWEPFDSCSASCGLGVKSRTRYLKSISIPSSFGKYAIPQSDAVHNVDLQAKFEEL